MYTYQNDNNVECKRRHVKWKVMREIQSLTGKLRTLFSLLDVNVHFPELQDLENVRLEMLKTYLNVLRTLMNDEKLLEKLLNLLALDNTISLWSDELHDSLYIAGCALVRDVDNNNLHPCLIIPLSGLEDIDIADKYLDHNLAVLDDMCETLYVMLDRVEKALHSENPKLRMLAKRMLEDLRNVYGEWFNRAWDFIMYLWKRVATSEQK